MEGRKEGKAAATDYGGGALCKRKAVATAAALASASGGWNMKAREEV